MRKLVLCAIFMVHSFIVFAQLSGNEYEGPKLPTFVPTSPETASLLKYQETPVSHYTGVPNISIPICGIQGRTINVPVSLSYHAGGIKVNEEASWVGLGWNLNVGGQITRVMRGLPDDTPTKGYLHTNTKVSYIKGLTASQRTPYMIASEQGELDTQPDEFSFSFMGYSGKYVFNQTRNSLGPKGQIIQIPKSDLIISPKFAGTKITSWHVTTPDGTLYKFGTTASSREESTDLGDFWFLHDGQDGQISQGSNPIGNFINSWKLTEIRSVQNDVVTFEYDKFSTNDCMISLQRSLIIQRGVQDQVRTKFTSSTRNNSYLKKITTVNGTLEFELTGRQDVNGQGKALRKIILKNNFSNTPVKSVDFVTDYFTSAAIPSSLFYYDCAGLVNKQTWRKRLRLQRIEFKGNTNIRDHNYSFSYNTNINLPHRYSHAQDFWGYYNGQVSNEHSLPEGQYKALLGGNFYFDGANRTIHPEYVSANMLTSVVYPEGGRTVFEYENNRYNTVDQSSSGGGSSTVNEYRIVNDIFSSSNSSYSESFVGYPKREYYSSFITVEDMVSNTFEVETYSNSCATTANQLGCDRLLRLLKYSSKRDTNPVEVWRDVPNLNRYKQQLPLTNGLYRYVYTITKDNFTPDDYFVVNSSYKQEVTNTGGISGGNGGTTVGNYGPGLRIKKITTQNEINETINFKEYEYLKYNGSRPTNVSSGILAASPFHSYYMPSYGVIHSSSIVPLFNTKGSAMNYRFVQERITDAITNTSKFNRFVYSHNRSTANYPTVPIQGDWLRGNLMNSDYNNYSSMTNNYDVFYANSPEEGNHFEFSESITPTIYALSNNDFPIPFSLLYRKIQTGATLVKEVTSLDKRTGSVMETKTEYSYGSDYLMPKEVKTTNSREGYRRIKNSYAADVNNTVLLAANRISEPIKVEVFEKISHDVPEEKLSEQYTVYEDFTGNYMPEIIKTAKGVGTLEDRIVYHSYDSFGHPTEVSKKDGTRIVYIWGYNDTQPVAKIEGAKLSAIPITYLNNIKNASNIDNDRTQGYVGREGNVRKELNKLLQLTALKDAQITFFTYDPLVGVTSITDPRGETIYYEYDAMNRLEFVKNSAGNILKEHKYNYKN